MTPGSRATVSIRVVGFAVALALSSSTVLLLNLDAGGWVLLLQLCATALVLPTVLTGGPGRNILHLALLIAIIVLHQYVRERSTWSYTAVVRVENTNSVLPTQGSFRAPADDPARVPLQVINDTWAIMRPDVGEMTVTWHNGADSVVVQSPMRDFFIDRSGGWQQGSPGQALVVLLLLIWAVVLADAIRVLFQRWRTNAVDHGRIRWALFFLLGVALIAVQHYPGTWLSNRFLSRPDDWLWYEKAAREILRGNIFLMPAPGGVEMWTALHAYIIAGFHLLLGPALGAIDAVMSGTHFLLVPAFLALAPDRSKTLRSFVALGILLFVIVDINPLYARRLLSDTVPLLLLVLVFIAWRSGRDLRVLAILFGVIGLQRLELLGLGPLFLLLHWIGNKDERSLRRTLTSVAILLAFIAPLALRKFVLHGNWIPLPLGIPDTGHVPLDTLLAPHHLWLNLSALFGDYSVLNPDLRFRFHWMPIHLLFVAAIVWITARRRWDRYLAFGAAAWSYVLLSRLISPSMGIYGHRHSLLLITLELIVIVLAWVGRRSAFTKQSAALTRTERRRPTIPGPTALSPIEGPSA